MNGSVNLKRGFLSAVASVFTTTYFQSSPNSTIAKFNSIAVREMIFEADNICMIIREFLYTVREIFRITFNIFITGKKFPQSGILKFVHQNMARFSEHFLQNHRELVALCINKN